MLPVTLNGEDVYLLHYRAEWSSGFTLRVGMQSFIDRSQGGIEARTPLGNTLRTRLAFDLQLFERESAEFRVALQRLGGKRVLCPVWPAAHRYLTGASVYLAPDGSAYVDEEGNPYTSPAGVTTPYLAAGVWLLFEEDWSAWAVLLGDEEPGFTPSATAVRVPLLLGRFEQRPRPRAHTDRLATVPISFVEQSPAAYALVPMTMAPAYGPSIGGVEIPVFPLPVDWSSEPEAGEVLVDRGEEQVGHGREPTSTYHPQDPARLVSASFSPYQWDELTRLLSFFHARRGQAQPFWLAHPLVECSLVAAADPYDTVLSVDDASLLGDNRYIFLAGVFASIASVDLEANTVTLDDALGVDAPAGTPVATAVLARFSTPELELRFSTDSLAETRIDFIELGAEYYLPTGEILRESFADLPVIAYLYRFTRAYPGQTIVNRYTSHERDLVLDGETFLARGIEHGAAKETIELEDVEAELKAPAFVGNPLHLFSPARLEVPLYCEIVECQVGPDGTVLNPISRLYGQVSGAPRRGQFFTARVGSILGEVSDDVPAFIVQKLCNVDLFSAPCGISEAAWTFTGTVDSISGHAVTLSSLVRVAGGGLPTIGDGWFASGRLWTGSGETYESRTIFNSTVGTGTVTLILSHPLNLTPGAPLYFAPGCGNTYAECVTKYDNRANFRGIPYLPLENPSLVAVSEKPPANSGMKK